MRRACFGWPAPWPSSGTTAGTSARAGGGWSGRWSAPPDADPVWRGRALAGLSLILWSQGDPDRAAPAAEAARAIAEAIGDAELLALAVHMLGLVEVVRGHWDGRSAS